MKSILTKLSIITLILFSSHCSSMNTPVIDTKLSPSINLSKSQRNYIRFFKAAEENDTQGALQIIRSQKNLNIDAVNKDKGNTALMVAAENGNKEVFDILLEKGAKVTQLNNNGENTLMLAAKSNQTNIIKSLLSTQSININAQNNQGKTALLLSAYWQCTDACNLLLDNGANPYISDMEGNNILTISFSQENLNILKLLLVPTNDLVIFFLNIRKNNLGLNSNSIHNLTNNLKNLRLISKYKPLLNLRNNMLCSPSTYLIRNKNIDIALFLESQGADISSDSEGLNWLILQYKDYHKNYQKLANLVFTTKNIEQRTGPYMRTYLIHAATLGHTDLVELLLNKGANIHSTGSDGKDALISSIWSGLNRHGMGNIKTIKLLIDRGANLNNTDLYGGTALFYASEIANSDFYLPEIRAKYQEIVDFLISKQSIFDF